MVKGKTTESVDSIKGIAEGTEESGTGKKLSRKEAFDANIKARAANGKWNSVAESLRRQEENNDQKHQGYRDYMDITLVERNTNDGEWYPKKENIPLLSSNKDLIEIIFSERPEDMWQLAANPLLIKAIQALSDRQREVIYWRHVRCLKTIIVAKLLGTSDRYIRKVQKAALEKMRDVMGVVSDNSGSGYVDTGAKVLAWMLLPTFMVGWEISKRIYPRLKRLVTGQAA